MCTTKDHTTYFLLLAALVLSTLLIIYGSTFSALTLIILFSVLPKFSPPKKKSSYVENFEYSVKVARFQTNTLLTEPTVHTVFISLT